MRYKKYLDSNLSDLTGQTIVITGANSGIGYEASRFLAYKGARIVMACRSKDKAMAAMSKIKQELPEAELDFITYDQADFHAIDRFVAELKQRYTRIDVFVCNAGIFHPRSADEMMAPSLKLTLGTNFIGLYYLMREITPYLDRPGKPTRVIFVTSLSAYHQSNRNFETMRIAKKSLFYQYADSKLAINRLFHVLAQGMNLHDFQDRKNISFFLMHPGVTPTNIINRFPKWFANLARFVLKLIVHHADTSALGIAVLAGAPHVFNGSYLVPRGLFEISGLPRKKQFPKRMIKGSGQFMYDVGRYVKTLEESK